MIIEEDSMLSSEIKNMLKKVGFHDARIHKAPCLTTFKALIRKYSYDLIICRYAADNKAVGHHYLTLYSECDRFSYECSYIFVSKDPEDVALDGHGKLSPDNILTMPFNFNTFKPLIMESLLKRKLISNAFREIDKGNIMNAISICDKVSRKKKAWSLPIYRAISESYIKQEEYDAALELLNDVRAIKPVEWTYVSLIEINSMLGNSQEVLTLAREFESLGFAEHPVISEVTAYNSMITSDVGSALASIEAIVERNPNAVSSMINLAYLYIASEQYERALQLLESIDNDIIFSDEQYFCIEESKLYLSVRLNIMQENLDRTPGIKDKLDKLLQDKFDRVDNLDTTRKLYEVINDINDQHAISSPTKIIELWHETQLPYRKLIIMAMAYYCGFIDEVCEFIESEQDNFKTLKNVNDSILAILYQKMGTLVLRKQALLAEAQTLAQAGKLVEASHILSKENPSALNHHVNLINTVIKQKFSQHHNVDSLMFQFRHSSNILVNHLSLKNPNNPQLKNIKKIQAAMMHKFSLIRRHQ